MFKNRKKIVSGLGVGKSENRMQRLFRPVVGLQASLVSVKEVHQEYVCEDSLKEIRNAILEAEYKKGKAQMALQNNQRFY